MKKLFSLMSLLLACVGAQAQSWSGTVVENGKYNHETVLWANITTNLPSTNLQIAAFVDGECRASAVPEVDSSGAPVGGNPLYVLRIKGDQTADQGKSIMFRVYDGDTGNEYVLPQALTFDIIR